MAILIHADGLLLHDVSRVHRYLFMLHRREPLHKPAVRYPEVLVPETERLLQVEGEVQRQVVTQSRYLHDQPQPVLFLVRQHLLPLS